MAAFVLPEEAEHRLWLAVRALECLASALEASGEAAAEIPGEQLGATLSLIREQVEAARAAARFDPQHCAP